VTPDEVVALLVVALARDGRHDPSDELTVLAWREVAVRGRWTRREAEDAIHAHYTHSDRFLTPGEITQRIQRARAAAEDRRRRAAQLDARQLAPANPPTPERRQWLRQHWRDLRAALDDRRSSTP
jgi:hypothetical protein